MPFAVPDGVSNWSGTYTVTTPVFQRFNGSLSVSYGGTPIYAEASDGVQLRTTASLTLRPTQSIRLEGSLVATRITRERDGSEYAQSTIPRVKLEYQPRRSLFFRVVTEYQFNERDALVRPDDGPADLRRRRAGEPRSRPTASAPTCCSRSSPRRARWRSSATA